METNHTNEIDLRKVVRIVWEHWWWFVLGVGVCTLLGMAYYLRKTPKWTTDASIVLRQKDGAGTSIDALSMLGLSGNTAAEDEVAVLSSRGLLYQAVDALNLWDASMKRGGLRWESEFRNPALKIDYIALTENADIKPFSVIVKPTRKGYKVKTKMGFFHRSSTRVADLSAPIETGVGTLFIHANRPLSADTVYRVEHKRRELVIAGYQKILNVSLHKKESNIIELSIQSTMPDRDKALLHQLIEQYNLNAIVDKNMLATNTAAFIDERLSIISRELGEAEDAVSDYKQQNNIANIGTQA